MTSRLTALMEGWLDPADAAALREHVEGCPECLRTLTRLEAAVDLLAREAGPVEPPRRGYEALLEASLQERDRLPAPDSVRMHRLRRFVAAAAVVLLAVSAALLADLGGRPAEETAVEAVDPDLLDELIQEHALATGQLPFSDGSYMSLMADDSGRR
jgi:anti-sigma factor RsiW